MSRSKVQLMWDFSYTTHLFMANIPLCTSEVTDFSTMKCSFIYSAAAEFLCLDLYLIFTALKMCLGRLLLVDLENSIVIID